MAHDHIHRLGPNAFNLDKRIIHLLLVLTLLACKPATNDRPETNGRWLVGEISTEDLLSFDSTKLERLDSIEASSLCGQYPNIHQWDDHLSMLRQIMPSKYLGDNLEYERAKNANDFLKYNYIYTYTGKLRESTLKGYLTRSISDPSKWIENGFITRLFLTEISGNKFGPVLISEYLHFIPIVEFERHSITKIYSDNSIEFVRGEYTCSDVIYEDGTMFCDSIRITTNYWIGKGSKELNSQSDTVRLEYEVK